MCSLLSLLCFEVGLSLTCPCNNVSHKERQLHPITSPLKTLFQRSFYGGKKPRTPLVLDLRSAPEGQQTFRDLPWTMEGGRRGRTQGPDWPQVLAGVPTITMEMVSTLVCLLSEVSLSPTTLTKTGIVKGALWILARWPAYRDLACAHNFQEITNRAKTSSSFTHRSQFTIYLFFFSKYPHSHVWPTLLAYLLLYLLNSLSISLTILHVYTVCLSLWKSLESLLILSYYMARCLCDHFFGFDHWFSLDFFHSFVVGHVSVSDGHLFFLLVKLLYFDLWIIQA